MNNSLKSLFARCKRLGLSIELDKDNQPYISGPEEAIVPSLLRDLKENKEAIIKTLVNARIRIGDKILKECSSTNLTHEFMMMVDKHMGVIEAEWYDPNKGWRVFMRSEK